jgi:hypothetical protein
MKPLAAYPIAIALVVIAALVTIRYSIPGTINGAGLLGFILVVVAIVLAVTARTTPKAPRDTRVLFHSIPPGQSTPGELGDLYYVTGASGIVLQAFRHNGHDWVPFTMDRRVRF